MLGYFPRYGHNAELFRRRNRICHSLAFIGFAPVYPLVLQRGRVLLLSYDLYLFNEDKIDEDIAKYKEASDKEERLHFKEYYGEKPPIVQAVYVRLMTEMNRRQQSGLHDSDKAYTSIYSTAEKIASRLKIPTYDFLTQRFYPFFAKSRNKRIERFYKAYSGKKLLK